MAKRVETVKEVSTRDELDAWIERSESVLVGACGQRVGLRGGRVRHQGLNVGPYLQ